MPVLGIVASQISGHLFAPSGAYDSISTTTLSSTTSSVTFSSIPSTYTHLQVRMIARNSGTSGAAARSGIIRFNSDAGSTYSCHLLIGDGSTASADYQTLFSQPFIYSTPDSNTTANVFGTAIIDILDYANTNKYKTVRSLSGTDTNGAGTVRLSSALWNDTTAISSITFSVYNNTASYLANSQFALYGIKGA
jgi:hypothetical protein